MTQTETLRADIANTEAQINQNQIQLDTDDVVRHRLVKEIVHAYDRESECEKDSESNKA